MSGTEDGHQDTHAAEYEGVKGPAKRPPGAQEQEDGEVNKRSQRGKHDPCKHKSKGNSRLIEENENSKYIVHSHYIRIK